MKEKHFTEVIADRRVAEGEGRSAEAQPKDSRNEGATVPH